MNILMLFTPSLMDGVSSTPPMAIYYLSTILQTHGHYVKVLDPSYIKKNINFDGRIEDDLVIKAISPNVPIVVGGIHASYFDDHILKNCQVDFVIRGEGEVSLPMLLDVVGQPEQYHKICNMSYREKSGKIVRTNGCESLGIDELEKFPFCNYNDLPKGEYLALPLETSRGCKYNCIFCSVFYRKKWRGYSIENVIEKIRNIHPQVHNKISNKKGVIMVDDCFSADPLRALKILQIVDQENIDLSFMLECRITDLLYPSFIEQLPKRLITQIQAGVETGYDEGLKRIRKGLTVKQLDQCGEALNKHGLSKSTLMSFIIGFPWESLDNMIATVTTAAYLSRKYKIRSSISWLFFLPSNLWKEKQKYNVEVNGGTFDNPNWIVDEDTFYKMHPNVTPDILKIVEQAILNYKEKGVDLLHFNPSVFWSDSV